MLEYYLLSIGAMLLCAVLGAAASARVKSAYKKYGEMPTKTHMTGYNTAICILKAEGVRDITVGRVKGSLTDHFHPKKKEVNLSDVVYGNDSIGACAVAAHEIGHVLQQKEGYFPYKLRSVLVAATNIGSRLAVPLVLIGVILDYLVLSSAYSDLGFYIALAGVGMYGLSTVFALLTLPVEYDASRRAKRLLLEQGILSEEELPHADKMLSAAAQTYVASLLTSLIFFLRFLLWVLTLFGRRRRR